MSPYDDDSSGSRIDLLARKIGEYEDFQRNFLAVRFGFALLLVLISGLFVWKLSVRIAALGRPEVRQQVQTQVFERVRGDLPKMTMYFGDLGTRLIEAYAQAFRQRAAERLPDYFQDVQSEYRELINHFNEDVRALLQQRLAALLERQTARILERYPELSDEEVLRRMTENVRAVIFEAAQAVVFEKFQGHLDDIAGIQEKMDRLGAGAVSAAHAEVKLLAVTLQLIGRKMYLQADAAKPEDF